MQQILKALSDKAPKINTYMNMETIKKNQKKSTNNLLSLLCISLFTMSTSLFAQSEPSVENLKSNLKAVNEEITRQEMMSYVFMLVGFIIVIAVAWFSTSVAKKRRLEREEFIKNHHANNLNIKHNMHDPYFKSQAQRIRK